MSQNNGNKDVFGDFEDTMATATDGNNRKNDSFKCREKKEKVSLYVIIDPQILG